MLFSIERVWGALPTINLRTYRLTELRMLLKFHGNGDLLRPNCLDFCRDAIWAPISCICNENVTRKEMWNISNFAAICQHSAPKYSESRPAGRFENSKRNKRVQSTVFFSSTFLWCVYFYFKCFKLINFDWKYNLFSDEEEEEEKPFQIRSVYVSNIGRLNVVSNCLLLACFSHRRQFTSSPNILFSIVFGVKEWINVKCEQIVILSVCRSSATAAIRLFWDESKFYWIWLTSDRMQF